MRQCLCNGYRMAKKSYNDTLWYHSFVAAHKAGLATVVMVRNALRPERDRTVMPGLTPVTVRGWLGGQGIAEFV
jgi:hypothetical protein